MDNSLETATVSVGCETQRIRAEYGALVNQKYLMHRLSLAKKLEKTLTFTLVTGHHMSVNLSAVGRDWVAGVTTGTVQQAAVFRVAALESVEGFLADDSNIDPVEHRSPALSLMLENLSRQSKEIVVYLSTRRWRGTLGEVGADWCDVETVTGALITIPMVSVLWLSVGSGPGDGDN